jgi:exosome complex component RRP41
VIQNDGSSKSAVFNAVTLALLDAGVPMKDFLVSTTVGNLNGRIMSGSLY